MLRINSHYLDLDKSYLFTNIARKLNEFIETKPALNILKLGIGDVSLPLPSAAIQGLREASDDLASSENFHGYGPEQGYAWLREKIAEYDYQKYGIDIEAANIFVSDGAKCDTANFLDILASDLTIAVADPVYTVYVDTNVMLGRKSSIIKLPCTVENNFMPDPPKEACDVIYLCSPNNPTGAVASKEKLAAWVEYALKNKALILFDAAYEAFVRDGSPRSIFEIEGAKKCAVEFRSFSKTAGFTGVRLAFTVVPQELEIADENNNMVSVHSLWSRRQTTKFNGASYIVQKAAYKLYSEEGQAQCKANIDYYLRNANILKEGLKSLGYNVYGGENSPYIWLQIPESYDSWSFFDYLLHEFSLVTTPGSGFGDCGEGYIRLSAFCSEEDAKEAIRRLSQIKK